MDSYPQSSPIRITRPKTPRGGHAPSSSFDYPQDASMSQQSSGPRSARPTTSSRTLAKKISKPRLLSKASEPTMPFSFQSPRPAPPLPSHPPPRPRTPAPIEQPTAAPSKSASSSKSRFGKHRRAKSFGTSDSRADTTRADTSQDSDESSILCSSAAEFDETLARHDRVLAAERRRKGLDPDPYSTPEDRKQRQLWADNLFEKLTKRIGETRFIKEIYRKREKSSSLGQQKDFDLHSQGHRSSNGTDKSNSSGRGDSSSSHQAAQSQAHSSFSSPHSSASAGYPRLPGNFAWSDGSQSPDNSASHGSRPVSKGKAPQREQLVREPGRTQTAEGQPRSSTDLVRKRALSGLKSAPMPVSSSQPKSHTSNPSSTSSSSNTSNPSSSTGKRPSNAPSSSRTIQHARSRSLSNASHRPPRSEPPAGPIPPVPGQANHLMQTPHRQRGDHKSCTPQVPEQFQDAVMPQTINTPGFSSDWPVRSSLSQSESATRPESLVDPTDASPRHSDPFAFTRNEAANSSLIALYQPGASSEVSQRSQLSALSTNGVRDTFGGLRHDDSMMLEDLITQAEHDLTILPERALPPLPMDRPATDKGTLGGKSQTCLDETDPHPMQLDPFPQNGTPIGAVEGEAWAKPALYYDDAAETSRGPGNIGARLASRLRTFSTAANGGRSFTAKKRSQRFLARQPYTRHDPLADAIAFSEPQEPFAPDLATVAMTASDSAQAILRTGAPHNMSLDSVATAVSSVFDVSEAASELTPNSSTSDFAVPRGQDY